MPDSSAIANETANGGNGGGGSTASDLDDDFDDEDALWDIDWDNPESVRCLIETVDSEPEEDPGDPYVLGLQEDRQRRIDAWGAAFFCLGVNIPQHEWERWVR